MARPKEVTGDLKEIEIAVACGHCGAPDFIGSEPISLYGPIEIGGGCSGHDAESYCYCPSPYLAVTWTCKQCGAKNKGQT